LVTKKKISWKFFYPKKSSSFHERKSFGEWRKHTHTHKEKKIKEKERASEISILPKET
jgi:hypothetical protein